MLTSINLRNFRSYANESFEFEPTVNIVVGPNTSGKTNLLEAILLICRGKSYRANSQNLIMHNKPWARIEAITNQNTRRVIKVQHDTTPNKTFIIDDQTIKRLPFKQMLPVVLFEPNQLMQIVGSPQKRRDFIDDLIEQTTLGYGKLRNTYIRVLAQRNTVLKTHRSNIHQHLFPWDVRLSEIGGAIVQERTRLIQEINNNITKTYSELASKPHTVSVIYESVLDTKRYTNLMLTQLARTVDQDIQRGFTGIGPHRDDIVIAINHTNIQNGSSRGEVRTLLLALKILESKLLEETRNQKPLMLLDDVFGELDGQRRKSLISHFKQHQTFITTTDADLVAKTYTSSANIIAL